MGHSVAVFCVCVTDVTCFRQQESTPSPFLCSVTQGVLRWAEPLQFRLVPQFLTGACYVLAGALSRLHRLPATGYSLHAVVFRSLSRQCLVQIDLFAASAIRSYLFIFSPVRGPLSACPAAFLPSWDGPQACAFPPWFVLPRAVAKLRVSVRSELLL